MLGECTEYFKSRPVLGRLLQGFREKYESYGSFSGTVVLRGVGGADLEDLEGFLQKNCHGQKTISVSAAKFQKALRNTRFWEIRPEELMEDFFGQTVESKKEQQRETQQKWEALCSRLLEAYRETPAEYWLREIQLPEHTSAGTDFQAYVRRRNKEETGAVSKEENFKEAERLLQLGAEIINKLSEISGEPEYLAVFAARLTGNPHAFDQGTKDGQYLYRIVQWLDGKRGQAYGKSGQSGGRNMTGKEIFPAVGKQKLYLSAGLLRDDVSNYAMLCGVQAWDKRGKVHPGMEGFFAEGDMVHVPLSVIAGWTGAACRDNCIYIVENPSVFALLCAKYRGQRSLMCMNGQPRLSSVIVLDLLAKSRTTVYYSGDFDPEGLLIAQKIRRYYPGEFYFWNMSAEDYKKAVSEEDISERRLRILDQIRDQELAETVKLLGEKKKAGYQENIWRKF